MGKNVDKNTSKNLNRKYSQKLLDNAKQLAIDGINTAPKRAIKKTSEATGDLTGNKTAEKISKVSKASPWNNSATNEEEIIREKFIPLELRHEITDDLRLKKEKYW